MNKDIEFEGVLEPETSVRNIHNNTKLIVGLSEGQYVRYSEGLLGREAQEMLLRRGLLASLLNFGETNGYLAMYVEKELDLTRDAPGPVAGDITLERFSAEGEARAYADGVSFGAEDVDIEVVSVEYMRKSSENSWAVVVLDQREDGLA